MRTRFLRQHQRRPTPGEGGEAQMRRIERYLLEPDPDTLRDLLRSLERRRSGHWAERVRQLATRLGRRHRAQRAAILRARDQLLVQLYAWRAPRSWAVGWFDGAWFAGQGAGAGGFLLAPESRRLAGHFARPVPAADAFAAERAGLELLLRLAVGEGLPRLWAWSDCVALVERWRGQPDDPSLVEARTLAARLERFRLWHPPPAHNPVAHRLARAAAGQEAAGPLRLDLPVPPLEIVREPKFCRCRLCHAHFHADTVAEARRHCLAHARDAHPDWGEGACFCPD